MSTECRGGAVRDYLVACTVAAGLCLSPGVAPAQTTNATAPGGNSLWSAATWGEGHLPTVSEVAKVTLGTAIGVTITNLAVQVAGMHVAAGNGNAFIEIANGGSLEVMGPYQTDASGAGIRISQIDPSKSTSSLLATGTVTTRRLEVFSSRNAGQMAYFTVNSNTFISSAVNVAVGSGTAGNGTLTITNGGMVQSVQNFNLGGTALTSTGRVYLAGGTVVLRAGSASYGLAKGAGSVADFLFNDGILSNSNDNAALGGFIRGNGAGDPLNLQLAGAGTHTISLSANDNTLVVSNNAQFVDQPGQQGTLNVARGTLAFYASTNTHSGGTTIAAGAAVRLVSNSVLSVTGALGISGALDLGGMSQTNVSGVSFLGSSVVSNGALVLNGVDYDGQAGTVSASLGGTAGFTKSSAGALTLSGMNSYGGATVVNGGALTLTGTNLTVGGVTVNNGGTLTLAGNAAGTTNLSLGSGTLTLNDGATFGTGNRPITNAVVIGAGNVTIASNVGLRGPVSGSGTITHTGTTAFNLSFTQPNTGFSGNITNTATLTTTDKDGFGTGTLVMKDDDLGGHSQLGVGVNLLGAAAITNPIVLLGTIHTGATGNGNDFELTGVISGPGGILLNHSLADPTLSAANTYEGDTVIVNGATLTVNHQQALQNSTLNYTNGLVKFGAGTTDYTLGGLAGSSNIGMTNNAGTALALTVGGNTSNTTYAGVLSQGGSLTKTGTGELTLSGPNTYTGTTTVNEGTLRIDGDQSLATGLITVAANAVLGGNGTVGGSVTLDDGAKLLFSTNETLTVSGAAVDLGDIGVLRLVGLDNSVAEGTYTLIDGVAAFDFSGVQNLGAANAQDLGAGKAAYFQEGSLQLVVIPEPTSVSLLGVFAAALWLRRRAVR